MKNNAKNQISKKTLEGMTVPQIKEFATDHNIRFKPRMNKKALIVHVLKEFNALPDNSTNAASTTGSKSSEQKKGSNPTEHTNLQARKETVQKETMQSKKSELADEKSAEDSVPVSKEVKEHSQDKKVIEKKENEKHETPKAAPTNSTDKCEKKTDDDSNEKQADSKHGIAVEKAKKNTAKGKNVVKENTAKDKQEKTQVTPHDKDNKLSDKKLAHVHDAAATITSDIQTVPFFDQLKQKIKNFFSKKEAAIKPEKAPSLESQQNAKQQEQSADKKQIADTTDSDGKKAEDIHASTNGQSKKQKKGFRRGFWRFLCILFSIIFIGTIAATYFIYQYYLDVQGSLPKLSLSQIEKKMEGNTQVFDKNGNFISNLAEASFVSVTYDELPEVLKDAISAAEDGRFLRHNGIDGPRTVQAVIKNVIADDVTSGGSTITQQLIKVTALKDKIEKEGNEYKHSNERKIHEWILSYQLEHMMSKEEIITAYFNTLGYGKFTGVGTAAKQYFNKNVSELTLPEAALLAGIPQASTDNNPYINMPTATKRYQNVVYLMNRHGYITDEEYKLMVSIPLADILLHDDERATSQYYSYFSAVEDELHQLFNYPNDDEIYYLPYYTGLKIYTEMDVEQQALADDIMDTNNYVDYLEMLRNVGIEGDDINLQAAFTVVDNKTGGIPAIGAARRFREHQNNFAIYGYRSPGSSIKPVLDYAPGVEYLGWNEFTPFTDRETFYTGTSFRVSNFGGGSVSNRAVSMQQAIAQSLNTTAVQAIQQVGVDRAGHFAGSLGISSAGRFADEGTLFESAALGGGVDTTTTEMAGAYSAFANGGQYNKPHFIKRIEDVDGNTIYEFNQENTQILSPNSARVMTNALMYTRFHGTPVGGGRSEVDYSIKFAAKTGTSSYDGDQIARLGLSYYTEKDHWHVGYSPEYSIAVWTGFNIEDDETLARTRGNVNANKSQGSHIMTAWINRFSPSYTDFNFEIEPNNFASISGLAISHDRDDHILSWKQLQPSYPTIFNQEIKDNLGPIVYDVYATYEDGKEFLVEEALPTDTVSYNYSKLLKDSKGKNFTIKIEARFLLHHPDLSRTTSRTMTIIQEKPDAGTTHKKQA